MIQNKVLHELSLAGRTIRPCLLRRAPPSARRERLRRRLGLEALEGRLLPSTLSLLTASQFGELLVALPSEETAEGEYMK
jgi:hypothetical protein